MTPEQAIKHKEVIKWWLDNTDKGVWYRPNKATKWRINKDPLFSINVTYVQNDEYAELRKAQADGKVIEFNDPMFGWMTGFMYFLDKPELYCIKPDEPKFKVDDKVIVTSGLLTTPWEDTITKIEDGKYYFEDGVSHLAIERQDAQLKPAEPKFKVGDWVMRADRTIIGQVTKYPYGCREIDTTNGYFDENIPELWQPQEGDIILGIRKGMTPCLMTYKDYKCQVDNFVPFDNVIPYIGQDFKEML